MICGPTSTTAIRSLNCGIIGDSEALEQLTEEEVNEVLVRQTGLCPLHHAAVLEQASWSERRGTPHIPPDRL